MFDLNKNLNDWKQRSIEQSRRAALAQMQEKQNQRVNEAIAALFAGKDSGKSR